MSLTPKWCYQLLLTVDADNVVTNEPQKTDCIKRVAVLKGLLKGLLS